MADADLQPKKFKKPARAKNPESEALLLALAENRVAIEGVEPEIDGGRFAVKRVVGEPLRVEADIFCDGHDKIDAALIFGPADVDPSKWSEVKFEFVENDRWAATVSFERPGPYRYSIIAWRDLYATWRDEAKKKRDAGKLTDLELIEARELDLINVVGKAEPVPIYELVAKKSELSPEKSKCLEFYQQGLEMYRNREFADAMGIFAQGLGQIKDVGPSKNMITGCEYYILDPPGKTWNGAFIMTSK